MSNNHLSRFVIWLCSKFSRKELELIILELSTILSTQDPSVKLKDDIKEKQPNYRNFFVDPKPPITEPPKKKGSRR